MENLDYTSEGNGVEPAVQGEGLLEKAVILCFKTGRFGNSKKVKQADVAALEAYNEEGGVEVVICQGRQTDMVKLTKRLLKSKELEAIVSHDGKTRTTILRKWCVPSFADEGYYFVPIGLVPEVDAYLQEREQERKALVSQFISVYRDLQEQERSSNPLYRERDYPSEDRVVSCFTWTVRYVSFGTPGRLQDISQSLYQREKERLAEVWQQAEEEVRQALREAWQGLIKHFLERLAYKDNGKPQVFRDTMTDKLAEFIDLFDRRNLTNDVDLAALVGQARQLLAGVDPEALRKNLLFRDRVRDQFEQIKRVSDSFLIDKPVRQIDFDD